MDVICGIVAALNLLGVLIGFFMLASPTTMIPGIVVMAGGISGAAFFGAMSALLRHAWYIRRAVEAGATAARADSQSQGRPTPLINPLGLTPLPDTPLDAQRRARGESASVQFENESRHRPPAPYV